jgi:predicted TIM-barrel fold metal-dependent hydrolase
MATPIFDSLSHPTLTGQWLDSGLDSTFETLDSSLIENNFIGACAVGLAEVEDYDHESFYRRCSPFPRLTPIAGISVNASEKEIEQIKEIGFKGIKLHPRYSNIRLDHLGPIIKIFNNAGKLNLPVFLCTYNWTNVANLQDSDPLFLISKILREAPETQTILVHGGGVDLLRYAELVRFNPNLLLDLSLTILKYSGSSLDLDIDFLFKNFDRRICIGTDHPEYSHKALRQKFEAFARTTDSEKIKNIAYKNITKFLGLKLGCSADTANTTY